MQIHAGRYKGLRVKTVKNAPYRPTTSLVRKSLFDILKNITGKNMLDLFSGSGIIGFEALSRGAKTITFVDSSLRVNSLLKMNLFNGIFLITPKKPETSINLMSTRLNKG